MKRVWLYQTMVNDATLMALVPGLVHQSTSLNATPVAKPYVMYRQTSDLERFRGDDGEAVRQVGYMIFVHDVPGDYMGIDTVLARLKTLFGDTVDQGNGIIRSRWLETSDDHRDEDMGTITKYARVEVTYRV